MLTQMASILLVNKADFVKMWHATTDNRMTGVFQSYEICIREICRRLGGILPFQSNNEIEKTVLWDYVTDIGYVDEIDNYIACVGKQVLQKLLR